MGGESACILAVTCQVVKCKVCVGHDLSRQVCAQLGIHTAVHLLPLGILAYKKIALNGRTLLQQHRSKRALYMAYVLS